MSKSNEEIIEELISSGAIELEGIDPESGEFLYRVTEKMKKVNRAFYNEHLNNIYSEAMYFWEKGLVDVDDFTSLNPKISLTSKAFDPVEILKLPSEKILLFERLKEVLGFTK